MLILWMTFFSVFNLFTLDFIVLCYALFSWCYLWCLYLSVWLYFARGWYFLKFVTLFNTYDVTLQILDQYKVSHDARTKEGAAVSGSLPKSVILVGHSMGGFVARAAIIHPRLRKSAVETVLTLSTPHQ